jgi:1,4-alpha-glucan branching enzyme
MGELYVTSFEGMGAVVRQDGVRFRVWAPNAKSVCVIGDFNEWSDTSTPLERGDDGVWSGLVPGALPGQEYRFSIETEDGRISRIDPYAREVTNSVGNAVITDLGPAPEDGFVSTAWNEMVIYEMHVGRFAAPNEGVLGTFEDAIGRLAHLKTLGINAVQIMPAAEFAGDVSWGYNPAADAIVALNFGIDPAHEVEVGLPRAGGWALRLNTDWQGYSCDFGDFQSTDLHVVEVDGGVRGKFSVAGYSALIFTS